MAKAGEVLTTAMRHHQSGDLKTAERLYREILAQEPTHPDALHLLGVIALQVGNGSQAVELIQRAIQGNPHAAPYFGNLGAAYQSLQRPQDAIPAFENAVRLQPDFQVAHANLGRALLQVGQPETAVASLQKAISLNGKDIETRVSLGVAWKETGRLDEAVAEYRRVLEMRPDYAEVRTNLGNALKGLGKGGEALVEYQRAVRDNPKYPGAHLGLGAALSDLGRLDEAIHCFRRVLELRPDYVEALTNLGNAYKQLEQFPQAIHALQRAVELRPNDREFNLFLAMALKQAGQLEASILRYKDIVSRWPEYAEAHGNLGVALQEQGEFESAIEAYDRALELKPDFDEALAQQVYQLLQTCRWDNLAPRLQQVIESASQQDSPISPFLVLSLPSSASEQRTCAQRWAARVRCPRDRFEFAAAGTGRITIGYLSGDFREHPVANQAVELFERHDREQFSIRAYSFGPDDDSAIRDRLKSAFDEFVDIRDVSFEQAAQRIHQDGVDILVDMMGYTRLARTQIVAMRPAPLQVSFLGYPGTMGADFIDYLVADEFVVPSAAEQNYSEAIVRLPGSFMVNDSQRLVDAQPTRQAAGLPNEGFVFCSFNQSRKIRPDVFDVWMRLLQRVDGSVLWLPEPNRFAKSNLQREAVARGVSADRLVFADKRPTIAEHLARVRCADLFLDTWPYNAHASASDALFVGCPVLTRAGHTFASRVAGSMLNSIALTELITSSAAEYEETAVALATDPDRMVRLREHLAKARNSAALFDGAQFAERLEQAYRKMWARYQAGEAPSSFGA